ncbi:Ctr copper transporter family-domain-containing protein [Ephemerocybe angulata]|uniref:Copper transport protein n=1 Tax=Ephemerocybe angulata TaxID=980116 RepID=A0A8H6I047_9AGAR|nr:Ctr copper transporter family-domain-containing protein [Tulosesus angulatus]
MAALHLVLASTLLYLASGGAHEEHLSATSTTTSMAGKATGMTAQFHTQLGDPIWLQAWVPQNKGALAGACIGLALLGILERWLAAFYALLSPSPARNLRSGVTSTIVPNDTHAHHAHAQETTNSVPLPRGLKALFLPRLSLSDDIIRGMLYAVQAALGFLLMLVVMTYQGYLILSIVLGLGVGEMLFGRIVASAI